jgi:hypothetical protein
MALVDGGGLDVERGVDTPLVVLAAVRGGWVESVARSHTSRHASGWCRRGCTGLWADANHGEDLGGRGRRTARAGRQARRCSAQAGQSRTGAGQLAVAPTILGSVA